MEPKVQTSFIPKKSLVEATSPRRSGISIFMLLGVAVFVISVFLAGGIYFYEGYLEGAIGEKDASLKRARAAFEPALIEDLKRLSNRINLARGVLDNHLAPSAIFSLLEESTLRTIRFRSFTYTTTGSRASIALKGEGRSFGDVAVQSDTFAAGRRLRDVIFSNLNLDQTTGTVVFDMSATVDPSLILYRNQNREAPLPPLPATTTPSTPNI